jgi:hypothetical protein
MNKAEQVGGAMVKTGVAIGGCGCLIMIIGGGLLLLAAAMAMVAGA